jgi:hypothetical protein
MCICVSSLQGTSHIHAQTSCRDLQGDLPFLSEGSGCLSPGPPRNLALHTVCNHALPLGNFATFARGPTNKVGAGTLTFPMSLEKRCRFVFPVLASLHPRVCRLSYTDRVVHARLRRGSRQNPLIPPVPSAPDPLTPQYLEPQWLATRVD